MHSAPSPSPMWASPETLAAPYAIELTARGARAALTIALCDYQFFPTDAWVMKWRDHYDISYREIEAYSPIRRKGHRRPFSIPCIGFDHLADLYSISPEEFCGLPGYPYKTEPSLVAITPARLVSSPHSKYYRDAYPEDTSSSEPLRVRYPTKLAQMVADTKPFPGKDLVQQFCFMCCSHLLKELHNGSTAVA